MKCMTDIRRQSTAPSLHRPLFCLPALELGVGIFDAHLVGGAAAGVNTGGNEARLISDETAAVYRQQRPPNDAGAIRRVRNTGVLLEQAENELVAAAEG